MAAVEFGTKTMAVDADDVRFSAEDVLTLLADEGNRSLLDQAVGLEEECEHLSAVLGIFEQQGYVVPGR
jgi:hypothetical protein